MKKKRKKENNVVLVATNVVASRLPKRRPTGTPHACANKIYNQGIQNRRSLAVLHLEKNLLVINFDHPVFD